MTSDQSNIVSLYTGASVVGFCICVIYLFFYRIFTWVQKYVLAAGASSHSIVSPVKFRSLEGPSGYIPLIRKQELLHPVLCCDIQKLPKAVLPLDSTRSENISAKSVSVCDVTEFTSAARIGNGSLQEIFGAAVYYQDPSLQLSAPTSVPARGQNSEVNTVLPVGWEVATTASGQKYYIDHNTKQTYWELPDVSHVSTILRSHSTENGSG